MMIQAIRSVHFIAICGTAMANLAVKMKEIGYQVTGSDENVYPPMSTFLAENQIPVFAGFSEENLRYQPDLVVIGNAVSRGNPEAEYVLDHKLDYLSLPEALKEFFLRGKQNIVVTGTHGKTTSAALLAWSLASARWDPSFMIGGIPLNFGSGFRLGQGKQFVLEGDEYDTAFFDKRSKFIHYLPEIAIVNNIEFDHCDIFRTIDDIKLSFRQFINLLPKSGLLAANGDDPIVCELAANSLAPVATFGFGDAVAWQISDIDYQPDGVAFQLSLRGKSFSSFKIPLAGRFNVMNATGVIVVLNHLGLSPEQIQTGFDGFHNVKRRLEIRGEVGGIVLYDDFAHHPTAVRETLAGLQHRQPQQRIWAIFEPRTNTTRRNIFQHELAAAFEPAYGVAFGKVNRANLLSPDERLDREQIIKEIQQQGKPAFFSDSVDEIIAWLLPQLQRGDQVVIMSNGGFDNIHDKLLAQLRAK